MPSASRITRNAYVSRRSLRFPCLLLVASISISFALASVILASVTRSYTRDKRNPYMKIPPNGNGVSGAAGPSWVLTYRVSQVALVGVGSQFDATSETMTIQWEIMGCGSYRLTTYPPLVPQLDPIGCDALDRAADVYLNR